MRRGLDCSHTLKALLSPDMGRSEDTGRSKGSRRMSWVEVPDAYDGRLGRSTPAILAREGRDKKRQRGAHATHERRAHAAGCPCAPIGSIIGPSRWRAGPRSGGAAHRPHVTDEKRDQRSRSELRRHSREVAMSLGMPSGAIVGAAPAKGWMSVAGLVAAAKAKPGALNFASAGLGSASHWAAERLRLAAGINVQHIPFRGPVEAFTEVMTGRVDFYYLPIAPALPNIRDGKVVALAVSTANRAPALPNVPTVVEAGYSEAQYLFWRGLDVPAQA